MAIRRMAASGRLVLLGDWPTADGRRRCRISPVSVRDAFPADGSERLRRLLMGAILAGRFGVPTPASRWAAPLPLEAAAEVLRG